MLSHVPILVTFPDKNVSFISWLYTIIGAEVLTGGKVDCAIGSSNKHDVWILSYNSFLYPLNKLPSLTNKCLLSILDNLLLLLVAP